MHLTVSDYSDYLMDHLPLPSKRAHAPVSIEHMCDVIGRPDLEYGLLDWDKYDEGPGTYYARFYRTIDDTPCGELESFCLYQTCCIFELIISIGRTFDTLITVKDLLHPGTGPNRILTTAVLNNIVAEMFHVAADLSFEARSDLYAPCIRSLRKAADLSRKMQATYGTSQWAHIIVCGVLVGETLTEAIRWSLACTSNLPRPRWAKSSMIEERMRQVGWCPRTTYTISDSMASLSLLYYVSNLEPTQQHSHDQCTWSACLHDRLDQQKYRTLHTGTLLTSGLCKIQRLDLKAWGNLTNLVKGMQVPVLTVEEHFHDSAQISVKPARARSYVCISHVWSESVDAPIPRL